MMDSGEVSTGLKLSLVFFVEPLNILNIFSIFWSHHQIGIRQSSEISASCKLNVDVNYTFRVANTLFQLLEESRDSFDITDIDGICSVRQLLTNIRSSLSYQSIT